MGGLPLMNFTDALPGIPDVAVSQYKTRPVAFYFIAAV
jgi:hypothetical protein